jgi:hypothetical protein
LINEEDEDGGAVGPDLDRKVANLSNKKIKSTKGMLQSESNKQAQNISQAVFGSGDYTNEQRVKR